MANKFDRKDLEIDVEPTIYGQAEVTEEPSGSHNKKNFAENPSSANPQGRLNGLCGWALSSPRNPHN